MLLLAENLLFVLLTIWGAVGNVAIIVIPAVIMASVLLSAPMR